jgi:ABC-type polysaccharide transport system permease subunit
MQGKLARSLLPVENKRLLDVMLLGILSAVTYFLPFAQYTHRKAVYNFNGYFFLTGRTILNQTVEITPVPAIALFAIPIILTILTGLLFKKFPPKRGGALIIILGIIQFGLAVIAMTQLKNIMPGVRDVSTGFGLLLMAVLGLVLIVRGAHILYLHRVITAIDLFVIPGGLYLLINNYFPMLGLIIAFKNIDYSVGILASPWFGLNNFNYLFTTADAWIITRNTVLYNLSFIVVGNITGIIVGICLANLLAKRMRKFYQTSILLPQLISYVIVGYIVFAFLSNEAGFINRTILGEEGHINFYATRNVWPPLLIFVNTWKMLGYNTIIYMSSIVSIDHNLYEAAAIDGAGRFKRIFKITLPMISPTIITLVIIQLGRMFYSDFGLFFQVPMNTGLLYQVTQTIDVYVYRMLMIQNRLGMASAASFYQSIVGFIVVFFVNLVVRKVSRENALF